MAKQNLDSGVLSGKKVVISAAVPATPGAAVASGAAENGPAAGAGLPAEVSKGTPPVDRTILLNDFVIESSLGEGGMGKVHLVRSQSTGQRFALKRLRLPGESARRGFLNELQTWIDLPPHENLTACRFFRSVGNEVLIFAEYVEGGALGAWIEQRRLANLEQVLDVAIQFAWSLHVIHELGLVHQDVKPGNVLMTAGGVVKLTDFGIARGQSQAGMEPPTSTHQNVRISSGGMTPGYCSPEQAQVHAMKKVGAHTGMIPKLTRQTDLWSWAVSVYEMFVGEMTWSSGLAVPMLLQQYFDKAGSDSHVPRMPIAVAEILNQCLQPRSEDRPQDMGEVVQALKAVYREEIGKDYPRTLALLSQREYHATLAHDRRTTTGANWRDPRE